MAWNWDAAGAGAVGGGVAGTMIMPGVGTAAGAIGGGLLGGLMGDKLAAQSPGTNGLTNQQWGRNQQVGNIQNLQAQAAGMGPSAAQGMIEKNRADNAARAMGQAKSMPGGDHVLANRAAADAIAQGNQEATWQGATLRAQEQQAAQQQLGGALNDNRGQDIDLYKMRQDINAKNKEKESEMLGGLLNMGGGMAGGLMGGG
jgi:hypothetical protein